MSPSEAPPAGTSVLESPVPEVSCGLSPPAVRIEKLNHSFGIGGVPQQVLFNIGLEICAGELVILTGPSGCGKTTLLTLIGALRSVQPDPDAPDRLPVLEVLGREMRGLDKKAMIAARRNIGFIFQAHNLLDALTALENVVLSLDLKSYTAEGLYEHAAGLLRVIGGPAGAEVLQGVARQREAVARALATGLLAHLGLGEHVGKKPNQLSGGQKQRVAIARALCNHPRLILADEPTAALDSFSSGIVIELLKRLTQDGTTILVVTHDNRIMDKGDRIVTMRDGRVVSNRLVDETERIVNFLQKVDLFKYVHPNHLLTVVEQLHEETFEAGTVIIREGDVGDKFYMIREGEVEITRAGSRDRPIMLGAGKYFGEVALLEDKPRNATVVARTRVEAYTLQKDDFLKAKQSFESLREELVAVLAQRSRKD